MTMYLMPILVLVSLGLIIYALWPTNTDQQDRVRRRMTGRKTGESTLELREKARTSVARKMMERVAPIAIKPVMPKDSSEMSKLRLKLCSAGFRKESASTVFLASKTIVGLGALAAGVIYSLMHGYSFTDAAGVVIFAAGLGFLAPNLWLGSVSKKRQQKVREGLADSLDLMVVAVEAGLGLDAALQRVGDELKTVHPDLSEEFQISVLETQMGIPRSEALDNLAHRTMVEEMRSLVAMINQAERFGTSIAKALRNQADTLRVRRRQAAEERAQQCAVKLLFPLMVFIFPSIFVVLAGPAALSYMESGL